jgi:5'-nucleotidase
VLPESLTLDGQLISAASKVRVTVNAYMASGGDNFPMLKQGQDVSTGMMDVDALELYVKNNPGLKPGTQTRVTRLN